MAYQMIAWKMEGKSDVEIKSRRFGRKAEIARLISEIVTPDTDIVTIGRTDRQSLISHDVWVSPRYVDLNRR